MRVLDIFEVAEIEMWPMWELQGEPDRAAWKARLDSVEYSAYLHAIERSRSRAILNEKIPPVSPRVALPTSHRFALARMIRSMRGVTRMCASLVVRRR